jgi:hypothetical protein
MGASQQALVGSVSGDDPPAESDALVASAGTGAANGTYTYTGTVRGKRYYNLSGTADRVSSISWETGDAWYIYGSGGESYYKSTEDTTYPWQVVTWTEDVGDAPAPTVTEV